MRPAVHGQVPLYAGYAATGRVPEQRRAPVDLQDEMVPMLESGDLDGALCDAMRRSTRTRRPSTRPRSSGPARPTLSWPPAGCCSGCCSRPWRSSPGCATAGMPLPRRCLDPACRHRRGPDTGERRRSLSDGRSSAPHAHGGDARPRPAGAMHRVPARAHTLARTGDRHRASPHRNEPASCSTGDRDGPAEATRSASSRAGDAAPTASRASIDGPPRAGPARRVQTSASRRTRSRRLAPARPTDVIQPGR